MFASDGYLNAVIPTPHRIMGVRLEPFSIGHQMLLQRFGSPFVMEGRAPELGDLCFAVWVCSRGWGTALSELDSKHFKRSFKWLNFKARLGKHYLPIRIHNFNEYLKEAHNNAPEVWRDSKKSGGKCKAPFLQMLKLNLMVNFHKSEADAMNTPFSLAVWDYLAYGETQGALEFVDEKDKAIQAEAKRVTEDDIKKLFPHHFEGGEPRRN